MMKRTIPVLFAVAILFVAAVPAQADHCFRCEFHVDYSICRPNTNFGNTDCDDSSGFCQLNGVQCRHTTAAVTPLASEFQVASVERIDEAPAPNTALVANLDAPKPIAEATR
jgi:hypothetical protein